MIDELAVVHVLLAAVALISCLSVPENGRSAGCPGPLWVTAVMLIPLVGSIGWFLMGRPHSLGRSRPRWQELVGLPEPPRPPAPEDDSEFLRSLDHPGLLRSRSAGHGVDEVVGASGGAGAAG